MIMPMSNICVVTQSRKRERLLDAFRPAGVARAKIAKAKLEQKERQNSVEAVAV